MNQIKVRMNDYVKYEKDAQVVKINVGGKVFTTTLKTLTKPVTKRYNMTFWNQKLMNRITRDPLEVPRGEGQHLLKRIFENENHVYDPKNLVFIDRNPRFFQIVLDYLQTFEMTLAEFFQQYGYSYNTYEMSFEAQERFIIKDFEFFELV